MGPYLGYDINQGNLSVFWKIWISFNFLFRSRWKAAQKIPWTSTQCIECFLSPSLYWPVHKLKRSHRQLFFRKEDTGRSLINLKEHCKVLLGWDSPTLTPLFCLLMKQTNRAVTTFKHVQETHPASHLRHLKDQIPGFHGARKAQSLISSVG